MADTAFVRHESLPELPPPRREGGVLRWLHENLFNSWFNGVLTLVVIYLLYQLVSGIWPWFANSVWTAKSLQECREINTGACFAVIRERWNQFLFGFYPSDQYWRPVLTFVLLCGAIAPVLFASAPRRLFWLTAAFPLLAYWLIWGGSFWAPLAVLAGPVAGYAAYRLAGAGRLGAAGAIALGIVVAVIWLNVIAGPLGRALAAILPLSLEQVASRNIGGFTLTLIIGVSAIAMSLPIGILLALGRQSKLVFIKALCVGFIEFIRGVPLITLLFVASVMLAYLLPPGSTFDLVLRVIIMVTLFASAYIAEVIRGGLAALPRGQYEAADAMGLDYWQSMRLIILPQALKISIPGIVNVFIGLFKDTTLVSIIGLLDPLGLSTAIRATSEWNGVIWEIYGFIALIFFAFCYGMSQYSQYLERKLQTGHH
jgi:general L-amino acid transport system permease protein